MKTSEQFQIICSIWTVGVLVALDERAILLGGTAVWLLLFFWARSEES